MPILRTDVEIAKYRADKDRIIPQAHLDVACKIGQGASTCRYLCSVAQDLWSENQVFFCVKNTPLKVTIDKEVMTNADWKAKGDNCDGFGEMHAQKESFAKEEST